VNLVNVVNVQRVKIRSLLGLPTKESGGASLREQPAVSNEMERDVSEAVRGSAEIIHNITGVAEAAQNTTR
jgi:hypothetical protein